METTSDHMKLLGLLNAPKNLVHLASWMLGNATFAFFMYWTADSFFPGTELSATAMLVKLLTAGLSFLVGLWLMHINHN
jgi:hypothetical protein